MQRVRIWQWSLFMLAAVVVLVSVASKTLAQSPSSLDNETMLSLVMPLQADGMRVGVHMWARADQARGPGDLPTVFVVSLYTRQGASGPEEREIINFLQSSNGAWALARPRDDGSLLTDEWAWISLNLKNLAASASGQGTSSQYTIDYDASGDFNGVPRQLSIEEVYAADLSLVSTTVLGDSMSPVPTGTRSAPAASPTARPVATPTAAPLATPVVTPVATPAATPTVAPREPLATPVSSARPPILPVTPRAAGPNTIRPASATP